MLNDLNVWNVIILVIYLIIYYVKLVFKTTVVLHTSQTNMSLWVDKYRPTSLGKLDYHKEQAEYLKNMVILS